MRERRKKVPLAAALAFAAVLLGRSLPAGADELIRLDSRPGVVQPYYLGTPASVKPVATLVMFSGGDGKIDGEKSNNFLVRTRDQFAAQGFLVAVLDLPSDHPDGLGENYRASANGAHDAAAVIADLRRRANLPVWLVGTSMGTVSASNAAARLQQGGPDGLVLTSSIIADNGKVQAIPKVVDVSAVTVPTILVHNRNDACPLCPFDRAQPFLGQFTHAASRKFIPVSGGSTPHSTPCEALSWHGYYGIEDQVVTLISDAIKAP